MLAIEWGVAERPIQGEKESGDRSLVHPLPDGLLFGVIDGLGHGPEAAYAARAAVDSLAAAPDADLASLLDRTHRALRKTRGAAISLASIDLAGHRLAWTGIGNVEAVLLRGRADARPAHVYVPTRGGIVGEILPSVHIDTVPLDPGDTIVLATDGIRTAFTQDLDVSGSPAEIARRILAGHGKETDDALVLVGRLSEGP